MNLQNRNIAVIGLGYVGFPLLALFSSKYKCWGLDKNQERIKQIRSQSDAALNNSDFSDIDYSLITNSWEDLKDCNVFIVAVPTPIDKDLKPDTSSLEEVCQNLGTILSVGSLVIFESTVFPGATEELCIPILEKYSSLKVNTDFGVGYSPERINVNDEFHQLNNTAKIISATNSDALSCVKQLYTSIVDAPILQATNIKTAEAAKMYENVQRDVLIALANEYSEYCTSEHIKMSEVTSLASSKWNFARVSPGLVGGHCIGVDPYYLLDRGSKINVHLPLVTEARNINETKSRKVADRILDYISKMNSSKSMKILVMGFSYKENCNDIRNTKIYDIIARLSRTYNDIECYDPLVDSTRVFETYHLMIHTDKKRINFSDYDQIIVAVNHACFKEILDVSDHVLYLKDFY